MSKMILLTIALLLIPAALTNAVERPLMDVTIKNSTGVTITVWAEYYHDHALDPTKIVRTEEQSVPPGGVSEFAVPVGLLKLHAETRGFENPASGRTYSADMSYQRNNPGPGRSPNPVYWGVTYENLGMDPSLRDPKGFAGKWLCDGYGILDIDERGGALSGDLKGSVVTHVWIMEYGKGTISGNVTAKNRADIYIEFPNGDYVRGRAFTMKKDGNTMSGLAPIMYSNGRYKSGGAHAVICYRMKK